MIETQTLLTVIVIFLFRRLDKKIYSEFADSRKEKKRVQRLKNGNANNVVFCAILAHPSHMQFLLKSQNTKVTNTQLKISYSKHIRHPYVPFFVLCTKPYMPSVQYKGRGRGGGG